MIYSNERGLSRSRNLAIMNADCDISVISDDDEIFIDGFEKTIVEAYNKLPDADIIIFKIHNLNKKTEIKLEN